MSMEDDYVLMVDKTNGKEYYIHKSGVEMMRKIGYEAVRDYQRTNNLVTEF